MIVNISTEATLLGISSAAKIAQLNQILKELGAAFAGPSGHKGDNALMSENVRLYLKMRSTKQNLSAESIDVKQVMDLGRFVKSLSIEECQLAKQKEMFLSQFVKLLLYQQGQDCIQKIRLKSIKNLSEEQLDYFFAHISSFKNLLYLELADAKKVNYQTLLSNIAKLRVTHLHLARCLIKSKHLKPLKDQSQSSNLVLLNLSGCRKISDSFLEMLHNTPCLQNLREVYLDDTGVELDFNKKFSVSHTFATLSLLGCRGIKADRLSRYLQVLKNLSARSPQPRALQPE